MLELDMCLHGAQFQLIWYATWLFSEKNVLTFDPTPGVQGACKDRICACMLLLSSFPLIWYSTWPGFEKSWIMTFLLKPPRTREGVYGQNILYHLIHASFPLIWYATCPYSKKKLALVPPHKSIQGAVPRPSN